MTIEEVLREIQARYRNNWPYYALLRLLKLWAIETGSSMRPSELQEYKVLYKWVLETMEAGIAFKQSQEE